MHTHVSSEYGDAKFRVSPEIDLASKRGHSESPLRQLRLLVENHQHEIIGAWRNYFGG